MVILFLVMLIKTGKGGSSRFASDPKSLCTKAHHCRSQGLPAARVMYCTIDYLGTSAKNEIVSSSSLKCVRKGAGCRLSNQQIKQHSCLVHDYENRVKG